MGLNGKTCYVLIEDHHTQQLWGGTFRSKALPVDYLNKWLLQYGLDDRKSRIDMFTSIPVVTLVVVLLSLISSRVQATKWRLPLLHRPI
jgi:hypothetical protein